MGVEEDLVPIPRNVDRNEIMQSTTFKIGADRSLRQKLCQLLILYDEVSIIHYETQELARELEDRGTPGLSAMRLQDRGLITFSQPPLGGEDRLSALKSAKQTLEGIWSIEQPLLELWEPAILGQMQAKGKLPHPSVYYLLKARRLGNRKDVERAFASVPNEARAFATLLLEDKIPMWDMVIFSTLNELLGVEEIVTGVNWAVASEVMHCPSTRSVQETPAAFDIFEIVVEELLNLDLRFPVCNRLTEVEKLRKQSEVSEFRKVFFPWLTSFGRGDVDAEKRLRRKIREAVSAFKDHRYAAYMGWLVAVAAIPLGLYEVITATALGIFGLGLPVLAQRWKKKSQWVGLCSKR